MGERDEVVDVFMAKDSGCGAFLFAFMQSFLASARSNKSVGLHGALTIVLKLIDLLRQMADGGRAVEGIIVVDLQDLSSIAPVVRSPLVLDECIDHARIFQKGNKISIVMTSRSWQAATESRTEIDVQQDIRRTLKYIKKKQDTMEMTLQAFTGQQGLRGDEGFFHIVDAGM